MEFLSLASLLVSTFSVQTAFGSRNASDTLVQIAGVTFLCAQAIFFGGLSLIVVSIPCSLYEKCFASVPIVHVEIPLHQSSCCAQYHIICAMRDVLNAVAVSGTSMPILIVRMFVRSLGL